MKGVTETTRGIVGPYTSPFGVVLVITLLTLLSHAPSVLSGGNPGYLGKPLPPLSIELAAFPEDDTTRVTAWLRAEVPVEQVQLLFKLPGLEVLSGDVVWQGALEPGQFVERTLLIRTPKQTRKIRAVVTARANPPFAVSATLSVGPPASPINTLPKPESPRLRNGRPIVEYPVQ